MGAKAAKVAKIRADMNISMAHGLYLGLGRAAAATDNCPGMAHAAAWGSCQASHKADHRFGDIAGNKGAGFLFIGAAYFADHDYTFCVSVFFKSRQTVDKAGAIDRVTPDADAGGLPQLLFRKLVNNFIGQGPGARNHTDVSRQVYGAGHDADLALARCDDARAVGAYEA